MRSVAVTTPATTENPLGVPANRTLSVASSSPRTWCPESAVVGPVPYNWLGRAGRLSAVLSAWSRGYLAEVPVGISFDVVRIPSALAADVLERLRLAWVSPGPVVLGAAGAEFLIRCGSARGWDVDGSCVLREGLALLPPPSVLAPDSVAGRGWLVPPVYRDARVDSRLGLGFGLALAAPVREAVRAAAEAAGTGSASASCSPRG